MRAERFIPFILGLVGTIVYQCCNYNILYAFVAAISYIVGYAAVVALIHYFTEGE